MLDYVGAVEQEAVEFVGDGFVVADHEVADVQEAVNLIVFDCFRN